MADLEPTNIEFQDNIAEINAKLSNMGIVGANAFRQIADAAAAGNWESVGVAIAAAINPIAGAVAGAVVAFANFVEAQNRAIEAVNALSQATGESMGEIQAFEAQLRSVGISADEAATILNRMQNSISRLWEEGERKAEHSGEAQAHATRAVEEAQRRLADAQKEAGRVAEDNALKAEQAAMRQEEAALRLKSVLMDLAHLDTHQAQERVDSSLAVRDAVLAIRDAELAVKDAKIAGEDAHVSLEEALIRQREAYGGPKETAAEKQRIEREKADIGVEKARLAQEKAEQQAQKADEEQAKAAQNLDKARTRDQELPEKQAQEKAEKEQQAAQLQQQMHEEEIKAQRDLVDATDRVTKAQQDLQQAIQDVAQAFENMSRQASHDIGSVTGDMNMLIKGTGDFARASQNGARTAQEMAQGIVRAVSEGGKMPSIANVADGVSQAFQHMGNTAEAQRDKWDILHVIEGGMRGASAESDKLFRAWDEGKLSGDQLLQTLKNIKDNGQLITPDKVQTVNNVAQAANTASGTFAGWARSIAEVIDKLLTLKGIDQNSINAARGGSGATGQASGGLIRGPGTGTSDQAGIFALSDGEYVIRAAAVSHYGAGLFAALNSLSIGGFATGGQVGGVRTSSPSAAGGGSSSILNLTIDGNHFNGLRAPDAVATKLKSFAVSRQIASAGRKPSWVS